MTLLPLILADAAAPLTQAKPGPFYDASTFARNSDFAFNFINGLCTLFFVLIVGVMLWFMWKYRRKSHVADTEGPTHNTPLEVTWTVLPLILVVAIFYVGMREYIAIRSAPLNSYEIRVIGQKWNWTLSYPNGESLATPTDVLLVPQNKPVKLLMESQDVLHCFFVPAFRTKQDVVPGRITTLWFEATKPGLYDLYCAEYCGTGHSTMIGTIEVMPEDQFEAELPLRADKFRGISEEDWWWKLGPHLYARCAACHTVDGTASTGPTWKGLWAKLEQGKEEFTNGKTLKQLIDEGVYKSPEDYVLQSIWFPNQHIVKTFGASMPTFKGQLDDRARATILRYIKELSKSPDNFNKDGTLKNPPKPSTLPPASTSASARETSTQHQP